MTEDHERIDEMLSGYVLRALSGEDAVEADRLVSEHVPRCARCRETLADLQAVAGELGLAAPPATPPDTLLPRLRRELGERPSAPRRPLTVWTTAAAAVLVLGLGGWNAVLSQRVTRAETQQATMAGAFSTLSDPASETLELADEAPPAPRLYLAYVPGSGHMYLFGRGVPEAPEGRVYWLWGVRGERFVPIAAFAPDDGVVVVEILRDPTRFDRLLIAEDVEGVFTGRPGEIRWEAAP
jgi:hypothetical protein